MERLPIWFVRAEGVVVLVGAVWLYALSGMSWIWFAVLFFVPDISLTAYLAGARVGAVIYNVAHSIIIPLNLIALSLIFQDLRALATAGLVWLAHIGLDRMLGYGLKYPDSFSRTTHGDMGRKSG